jgi:hypothetical protein
MNFTSRMTRMRVIRDLSMGAGEDQFDFDESGRL